MPRLCNVRFNASKLAPTADLVLSHAETERLRDLAAYAIGELSKHPGGPQAVAQIIAEIQKQEARVKAADAGHGVIIVIEYMHLPRPRVEIWPYPDQPPRPPEPNPEPQQPLLPGWQGVFQDRIDAVVPWPNGTARARLYALPH